MMNANKSSGPQPPSYTEARADNADSTQAELDSIIFKDGRIYRHNILHINYTTYDVRRAQDTVNPNTDHQDIMLLSHLQDDHDRDSSVHQYKYARVLGVYHTNVIYTGSGMLDYRARRMEFLWVRWFENVNEISVQDSWSTGQLDVLKFPDMYHEDAFGFVDPTHVVRAFHALPRFARGLRHPDEIGISECARDSKDWKMYYANR
jgi:hypothetical protein